MTDLYNISPGLEAACLGIAFGFLFMASSYAVVRLMNTVKRQKSNA